MSNKTSQEFNCEVDSKARVLYEQAGVGLKISMQSRGEVDGVFLGPGQIDSMIAFLNKLRGKP